MTKFAHSQKPGLNCRWKRTAWRRRLPARAARRARAAGFTLAEVLAALLFMAIVVPVAIEAMHLASLAGTVAQRKGDAARVAQRILNEMVIATNWNQAVQSGTVTEGQRQFTWTLRNDQWTADLNQSAMRQLSVQVDYTAQNRTFSVSMSTLVDGSQNTSTNN
jgi:Tfp pilus assembly protein PilV